MQIYLVTKTGRRKYILCLVKKNIPSFIAERGWENSLRVSNTTGIEGIAIILSLKFHLATGSCFIFVQLK